MALQIIVALYLFMWEPKSYYGADILKHNCDQKKKTVCEKERSVSTTYKK